MKCVCGNDTWILSVKAETFTCSSCGKVEDQKPEWGEYQGPGAYWVAITSTVFCALVRQTENGKQLLHTDLGDDDPCTKWTLCGKDWKYQPYTQEKPDPPEKEPEWTAPEENYFRIFLRNGEAVSLKAVLDVLNGQDST